MRARASDGTIALQTASLLRAYSGNRDRTPQSTLTHALHTETVEETPGCLPKFCANLLGINKTRTGARLTTLAAPNTSQPSVSEVPESCHTKKNLTAARTATTIEPSDSTFNHAPCCFEGGGEILNLSKTRVVTVCLTAKFGGTEQRRNHMSG